MLVNTQSWMSSSFLTWAISIFQSKSQLHSRYRLLFSIVHYIMIISIFKLNTALFLQDFKSCFPLLTFYINDLLLQSLSKNHQRFSHQKLVFQTLTKIQFWLISFSINSSFYLLLHTFNTSSFFLTMSHSLFSHSELSSYNLTVF